MDPRLNPQLIRQVRSLMRTMTGRDYRINLNLLDAASLQELVRLLRDLDDEKRTAVRRAQITPWRR